MRLRPKLVWMVSAVAGLLVCCSGTEPTPSQVDFVLGVGSETLVLRSSDAETILNAPWSWRLDPDDGGPDAKRDKVVLFLNFFDGTAL